MDKYFPRIIDCYAKHHKSVFFTAYHACRGGRYDWETSGVMLDNSWTEPAKLYATDSEGYEWQEGAR
ncbi:MAG: hypothetical protein M3N30_00160, partial [Bacteroidota bacterium]|nr:hypothetical protein [Bacteroidota bacterium]